MSTRQHHHGVKLADAAIGTLESVRRSIQGWNTSGSNDRRGRSTEALEVRPLNIKPSRLSG
jgi:hypothetical protein